MSVGNTDIALFNTVASELQLTGTPMKMTDLYGTAWTANQVSSGSFHNFNNLGVTSSDSFVTAIWNQSATGAMKPLGNWQGYNHDHNAILDINVTDNTGFGIDAQIEIYLDTGANLFANPILNTNMTGGTPISQPNYDTGLPAYSYFNAGTTFDGYFINVRVTIMAGPNPCYINFTAVDTDSVGAGTFRQTYTDVYGFNFYDMPTNGNFFQDYVAGRDILGAKGVYWNKRTDFRITFDY